MSYTGNTVTNLSALQQSYYDKLLLKRVSEKVVFSQLGQKRPLPAYEGKTITFSRYDNLAVATTALDEGVNPSGSNLSATNVSATIAEYGDFISFSSLVSSTSLDKNLSEKVPILATQMAETVDRLIGAELATGATELMCSTAANQAAIAATDVLTMTDVRKVFRNLTNNKAMPYNGYFCIVVDPYVAFDIQNDTTFLRVGEYNNTEYVHTGEIGKWFGMKVIRTSLPFRSAVGNNTYSSTGAVHWNFACGKEAFGVSKLAGGEKKIIVKMSGPQDTSNPLNRFGTAGWYTTFVTKTLNSNFLYAVKTGATA